MNNSIPDRPNNQRPERPAGSHSGRRPFSQRRRPSAGGTHRPREERSGSASTHTTEMAAHVDADKMISAVATKPIQRSHTDSHSPTNGHQSSLN